MHAAESYSGATVLEHPGVREGAGNHRQEEALLRKIADLEQFAYVAAHDLHEPLRAVAAYLRLIAERHGHKLDAEAAEFLGFALQGAERMQTLIDQLLLAACDPAADTRRLTNASDAVSAALGNLEALLEESHATIRFGNLPQVLANPALLMLIFQNLLSNAIKFRSTRNPEIAICCDDRDGEWVFRVSDNGRGLDPQRHRYGLGMTICRRIAERHGGRVWVASSGEKGTTVCFTLAKV